MNEKIKATILSEDFCLSTHVEEALISLRELVNERSTMSGRNWRHLRFMCCIRSTIIHGRSYISSVSAGRALDENKFGISRV